jgi:carboxymethylenebutenolidase
MNDLAHLDSLTPAVPFTRRGFIVSSLSTGFALAVQPVVAQQVITTSAEGLVAGEVKIPASDGSMPGYRACPQAAGRHAVILVVQEIFGVHEHIQDLCRRLAKLGYFAVAPALYARQGDPSKYSSIPDILSQVVSKVPDEQVMSDLDATVAWAQDQQAADTARLGITGFCWGGRIVWLYSAHSTRVKAGVAWYGPIEGDKTALKPANPIDIAGRLNAPVLGLYGGADAGISAASVEHMREAVKAAGKTAEIIVYPDTPHGFNADYRPSYRKEAAEDGWKRMQAWFKSHGVA